VYWRIGLDPMKAQHSMGTPVFWVISTIGLMSATTVRAAQFGLTVSRSWLIARASCSTSAATRGPAPGSPMSAVSMPSASIRIKMSIFSSMVGERTDGDCSPSRSVSSSSIATHGPAGPSWFQS
jgi:hypothetical protein